MPEFEHKGLSAVSRGVEFGAVCQSAGVMDFDRGAFRRKGRPVARLSGGFYDTHVPHSTRLRIEMIKQICVDFDSQDLNNNVNFNEVNL